MKQEQVLVRMIDGSEEDLTAVDDGHLSGEDEVKDPNAVEDRFRVDRRKLEQMLPGADEETSNAELFFQQIMVETETVITWPSKLKIGAKSKKDPHIKITGKIDAVKNAKERVMAVLDTKSNRVTLKMDVPFTDHSHIIGKGGNSIKKVMFETGCHIHFPDSNRSNPTEKSNQVSIAGEPAGVEKARSRIRESLPLIYSFDIPVTGYFQPIPDPSQPEIMRIQQIYGVSIQFRQKTRQYASTVMVRGSENQEKDIKAGTQILIDYLCGTPGYNVPVTMTMEVAQQHHVHVMGRGNANINLIMQQTGTSIRFPESTTGSVSPLILPPRKSTITISGSIEGVYSARQKLIGCLPLVLMFDMKEDQEPDPTFITCLMEKYGVYVSIKPKPKQPNRAIIVKGSERNVFNLFEARRYLLGLQCIEASVQTSIPTSYSLSRPLFANSDASALSLKNVNSSIAGQNMTNGMSTNSLMPSTMANSRNTASNGYFSVTYPQWHDYNARSSENLITLLKTQQMDGYEKASSVCSSTTSTLSSPNPSPRQGSPVEASLDIQMPYSTADNTSGIDSLTYALAKSALDQLNVLMDTQNAPMHFGNGHGQPDGIGKMPADFEGNPSLAEQAFYPLDYDKKRMLANKAMKLKPQGPESRVPTRSWSGYGFSKSMPESAVRDKLKRQSNFAKSPSVLLENVKEEVDNDPWRDSDVPKNGMQQHVNGHFSSSNYIDGMMLPRRPSLKHTDLCDLLSRLGLDRYIDLFLQQEIDLATFMTMTDQDLKELGIVTFGARRKMLIAISGIGKQKFSVAPGAERSKIQSMSNLEHNGKMSIPEMATVPHW